MAVRIFKTIPFHRWATTEGLSDDALAKAAAEIESGLVDARLGGFLVKKRIARAGAGKRGGYRTILAHRQESRLGARMFFLVGYAKNEKDDLHPKERDALIAAGDVYMKLSEADLDRAVSMRKLLEVTVK